MFVSVSVSAAVCYWFCFCEEERSGCRQVWKKATRTKKATVMKLLVTIPILLLGLGSAMSAKKGSEAGKLAIICHVTFFSFNNFTWHWKCIGTTTRLGEGGSAPLQCLEQGKLMFLENHTRFVSVDLVGDIGHPSLMLCLDYCRLKQGSCLEEQKKKVIPHRRVFDLPSRQKNDF